MYVEDDNYRYKIRSRRRDLKKAMWIIYAFGSAFFAGITAILAKLGIKDTDSSVVTIELRLS